MIPTIQEKTACRDAKVAFRHRKEVTAVYLGFKRVNGRVARNGAGGPVISIVVGVREKLSEEELEKRSMNALPSMFLGIPTDVVTARFSALGFTQKRRPCPPGYSIGHVSITAGTLGTWVHRGNEDWLALSNNHVLANSNDTRPQETIIQPGKADGGFSGSDAFARLTDYVRINFDGAGGKKDKKSAAGLFWKASKLIPNALAKLVGCPYRLVVRDIGPGASVDVREVGQPTPNLVDAAIAKPLTQSYVDLRAPVYGQTAGIRDLELGQRVQKVGRTTEHTIGIVEGVDAMTRVQYGTGTATFEDQLIIRGEGDNEFSAGGDSGSAIVDMDARVGGLLFAGGDGITVANRIANVVALLGVTV